MLTTENIIIAFEEQFDHTISYFHADLIAKSINNGDVTCVFNPEAHRQFQQWVDITRHHDIDTNEKWVEVLFHIDSASSVMCNSMLKDDERSAILIISI